MSAAHTAGPWRYQHGTGRPYPYWKIDAGDGTRHVAEIFQHEDATAEQAANARLIAAAPTLLDALKGLLSWLEDGTPEDCRSDEENACIRDGRAALAAAEGV